MAKETKTAPDWIECKVHVRGCHVGTIDCRIPGATPADKRHSAALLAAANIRGIALNESGRPQFGTAPEVEYLEN